jgi:hypothetical protein
MKANSRSSAIDMFSAWKYCTMVHGRLSIVAPADAYFTAQEKTPEEDPGFPANSGRIRHGNPINQHGNAT